MIDQLWKFLPVCAVFLAACAHRPPLRTAEHVDLPRFMGDWYVISLLPWFAERGNVNTMDIYALRDDGRIDITYAFRKGELTTPRKK
jgi:apolipoprotein D and lipocalin family protein